MDLAGIVHAHAARTPEKTALFCGESRLSYRELDQSSTALAEWLRGQGLEPGDRIAIHWSNSIEVVQILFGAFKAGLIAVTVNVRLKTSEVAYILEHSRAGLCFSEPALAPIAIQTGVRCPIHSCLPALQSVGDAAFASVDPDDPAVILYTSGTTAHPKGVTHTHRSLLHSAHTMAHGLIDTDDTVLAVTQLMHAAALNVVLLPALYKGAAAVLLPGFDPAAALNAIEQFRVTYAVFLPALLQFVLEEQQRSPRDVSSLRAVLAGGDTVSVALQERAVQLFSRPVQEVYGMTEAVPITVTPGDGIRPGSIGMVAYGCEIRLVDPNGADVADGAIGEIVVRSRAACRGYWADPEATAAALGNGWLRTGDLASRDADGYYWFKGRCKQLIIRAGSNISPQEVEEILYQHPAVLEAGVIGSPDAVYGETVVAFVTLRRGRLASPDELRQFARERLADYKVPERIILLDELPKGLTGKVHRRALKEMVQTGASPNCVMGYQRT